MQKILYAIFYIPVDNEILKRAVKITIIKFRKHFDYICITFCVLNYSTKLENRFQILFQATYKQMWLLFCKTNIKIVPTTNN